jgi:hypothetical protein
MEKYTKPKTRKKFDSSRKIDINRVPFFVIGAYQYIFDNFPKTNSCGGIMPERRRVFHIILSDKVSGVATNSFKDHFFATPNLNEQLSLTTSDTPSWWSNIGKEFGASALRKIWLNHYHLRPPFQNISSCREDMFLGEISATETALQRISEIVGEPDRREHIFYWIRGRKINFRFLKPGTGLVQSIGPDHQILIVRYFHSPNDRKECWITPDVINTSFQSFPLKKTEEGILRKLLREVGSDPIFSS